MQEYWPNILVIAGSGRNTGKTTLVCSLISKFSDQAIVSVKISPHIHHLHDKNKTFVIEEETTTTGRKDSSKMLLAGAEKVFFVQAPDNVMEITWHKLKTELPDNRPVIIESGGITSVLNPGLCLYILNQEHLPLPEHKQTAMRFSDMIIDYHEVWSFIQNNSIQYQNRMWKLK